MIFRIGLVSATVALSALGVGCGSDDKAAEAASSAEAIKEIDATRAGLDAALASYRSGDAKAADKQVGDAYLKHFEIVEGPLDKADHELNEKLEHEIREELRDKIKAGAPKTEVEHLVAQIKRDLATAESKLK